MVLTSDRAKSSVAEAHLCTLSATGGSLLQVSGEEVDANATMENAADRQGKDGILLPSNEDDNEGADELGQAMAERKPQKPG